MLDLQYPARLLRQRTARASQHQDRRTRRGAAQNSGHHPVSFLYPAHHLSNHTSSNRTPL